MNTECYKPLFETSIKRLMTRHMQNGFIIISACRNAGRLTDYRLNRKLRDNLKKVHKHDAEIDKNNKDNTKRLQELIIESGWSYIKIFGSFKEDRSHNGFIIERSFIVFNENRKYYKDFSREDKFKKLLEHGMKWGARFNQDSILVAEGDNKKPFYVLTSARERYWNKKLNKNIIPAKWDLDTIFDYARLTTSDDDYYSSLSKSSKKALNKQNAFTFGEYNKNNGDEYEYNFNETCHYFVGPKPKNITEAIRRIYGNGEIDIFEMLDIYDV